jgi:hypothetical protein
MTQKEIARLADLDGHCGYHGANKKEYRRLSMKILRALAEELRLESTDVDIRYNRGGIAASGDSTLHADHIYVTLNMEGMGLGVLVRTCRHRKDYTGGPNHWFPLDRLRATGIEALAAFARQVIKEGQRVEEDRRGAAA